MANDNARLITWPIANGWTRDASNGTFTWSPHNE
jgi:hypothetical protein